MKSLILTATVALSFSGLLLAQQAVEVPATQQKLEKIIIPRVQFRDATLEQALEYLRVKSRELDTLSVPPTHPGVSIVLRKGEAQPANLSLDLSDTPLLEALRYCAEQAGMQYRVETHAVVVAPNFEEQPTPPAATPPPVLGNAAEIILPSVQFRDATVLAAAEYLRVKSRDLDPAKQGINIVVKPGGADAKISLDLRNIPLPHALLYVAELSGHQLTTDGQSYLLTP